MKRLNLFVLGLAALTTSMMFTSCDTSENPAAPTITFTNGVTEATTASSPYTITGTITSEVGLKTVRYLKVTTAGEDQLGIVESFTDKNSYQFQYDVTVSEDMTVKVEATDKDNQVTARNFVITYTGGALTTVGNATLGAGGSATGSYYSVSENKVYTTSTVSSNADKVDFVFDSDASTARIYSPSLSSNTAVKGSGRITYFKKVTFDFDAATAADVDGVDPTDTEVSLTNGDVVVYDIHDGSKGAFKVTDLKVASDGTVTISVKVK